VRIDLRDVIEADLLVLFEHQLDPEASRMAALYPRDRESFTAHWCEVLADTDVAKQTVLVDGRVAGYMVAFTRESRRDIGYWIGREYGCQGIATTALARFLRQTPERPLHAIVAASNEASLRVLAKCGFERTGTLRSDCGGRGPEVDEVILELR
jgi:RimJ/RimL family protein N-acetyltransferase